jgi:molybdopterin converting factor small subunit
MGRTRILIPGPLLSYTKQRQVDAAGLTLGAVLEDLDRQYPGIRFRMVDEQDRVRPHMRIFINGAQVSDLHKPLTADDTVHIVQALSGG